MPLFEGLGKVLIVSPHADDEVLGCGGLMKKLSENGAEVHVVYGAVDGFHHYGSDHDPSYGERVAEIEAVTEHLGASFEILYGDKDLIEKLDTVPQRDLVDFLERTINDHRPDLFLFASGTDYDQDHRALFRASVAAARPIAEAFGKYLVPNVMAYESTKIQWSDEPLPRSAAFCDVSGHLDAKIEALKLYETQFRPNPHIRSPESVAALAEIRGKEIGVRYAEAFSVLRMSM